MSINKLIKIEEAGKILSVKPWTLRSWVSERRIPFIKVGRLVRFDEERLKEWIQENSFEVGQMK